MSGERCFIGWDRFAVDAVCDHLLPASREGLNDLSHTLVVVPTRQTGRRLREKLALAAEREGGAILAPRVLTPHALLQSQIEDMEVASDVMVSLAWTDLLMNLDMAEYPALFPVEPLSREISWAFNMGRNLNRLRRDLLENRMTISTVVSEWADALEELERWQDMARLEDSYLATLSEMGCEDPCTAMISQARNPNLDPEIERIVVAAVSDPPNLALEMIDVLKKKHSLEILIYAPQEREDWFDTWGRPVPEKWIESPIPLTSPDENIIVAANPQAQAQKVVEVCARESDTVGPGDITIGVPDQTVVEPLESRLDEYGLSSFNPAGSPLKDHPLYLLLKDFANLLTERSFASFRRFATHTDILAALQSISRISPHEFLVQTDRFKNRFLPLNISDIEERLEIYGEEYPSLRNAFGLVQRWIAHFERADFAEFLPAWLEEIYAERRIPADKNEREALEGAVDMIVEAVGELSSSVATRILNDNAKRMSLLLQHLHTVRLNEERGEAAIDLLGWVELLWEDARLLVVTGVNEGSVPESQVADLFLPDNTRGRLGLKNDREKLVRDIYFMHAISESRAEQGRACFVSGRTTASGDPLKPSRLLFHCDSDEVVSRAMRLFGALPEGGDSPAPVSGVKLDPVAPLSIGKGLDLNHLSVTGFKDYLECPFRFYLKRVCRLEPFDQWKTELDALDFGNLIHEKALKAMGRSPEFSSCRNAVELGDFLESQVRESARRIYGEETPVPVTFQIEMAAKRLRAFALQQVELVEEGWEIVAAEKEVDCLIDGLRIKGKIDRIDRHRENGRVRLIDYKTSDKPEKPDKKMRGTIRDHTPAYAVCGNRAWYDLQLPLYAMMTPAEVDDVAIRDLELALFYLPKASTETGLWVWQENTPDTLASAKKCAEGVVADIRNRRFWPPAERVKYDDYASLMPAGFEEIIDTEKFQKFLEGRS